MAGIELVMFLAVSVCLLFWVLEICRAGGEGQGEVSLSTKC